MDADTYGYICMAISNNSVRKENKTEEVKNIHHALQSFILGEIKMYVGFRRTSDHTFSKRYI